MGKAKKRSFHLGINQNFSTLTREDAVKETVSMLKKGNEEADNLITLFGLSAEELLEGGASYEEVKSRKGILK